MHRFEAKMHFQLKANLLRSIDMVACENRGTSLRSVVLCSLVRLTCERHTSFAAGDSFCWAYLGEFSFPRLLLRRVILVYACVFCCVRSEERRLGKEWVSM